MSQEQPTPEERHEVPQEQTPPEEAPGTPPSPAGKKRHTLRNILVFLFLMLFCAGLYVWHDARTFLNSAPETPGKSLIVDIEPGMTLAQAAYSAAKVRLRPILMTVLSMVFGLVPLMMAHGVGANGSRSLATGVIGGMIVGTLALLFLVPSLFIVFQYIQERVKHN